MMSSRVQQRASKPPDHSHHHEQATSKSSKLTEQRHQDYSTSPSAAGSSPGEHRESSTENNQQATYKSSQNTSNSYVYHHLSQALDQDNTMIQLQSHHHNNPYAHQNQQHIHHHHQFQLQLQQHQQDSYNYDRADTNRVHLMNGCGPLSNQISSYRSGNNNSYSNQSSNDDINGTSTERPALQQIGGSCLVESRLCASLSYSTSNNHESSALSDSHLSEASELQSQQQQRRQQQQQCLALPDNQSLLYMNSHHESAAPNQINQQHPHLNTSQQQHHYALNSAATPEGCCDIQTHQHQHQYTSITDACYEQHYGLTDSFYEQQLQLNGSYPDLLEPSQLGIPSQATHQTLSAQQQQHSPTENYQTGSADGYVGSNEQVTTQLHELAVESHQQQHQHHHHQNQNQNQNQHQLLHITYHSNQEQQLQQCSSDLVSHNYHQQQIGENCASHQQSIAQHQPTVKHHQQRQYQQPPTTTTKTTTTTTSPSTTASTIADCSNQQSNNQNSSIHNYSPTTIVADDANLGYTSLQQLSLSCESYSEHQVSTTSVSISSSGGGGGQAEQAMTSINKMRSIKGRRGRPRKKGSRSKNKVNGKLWEFIRDLLLNDRTNPSFIRWERREDGVFKFVQSDKVAKMWGERKQNPKMTYEKLSRAMRYYYKSKVLLPVFGRRLVYKFGPNATGWLPETGDPVLTLSAGRSH